MGFFSNNEELTCYPGIGGDELGVCGQCHILDNCQLGFQSTGLLDFFSIVGARFVLFPVEAPNEITSPFIKVVKKGFDTAGEEERGGALEASLSL